MRSSILILAAATLINFASSQMSHADIFHYACHDDGDHYSVVVDTDKRVVKMTEMAPTRRFTIFHILKDILNDPDTCAKGGWKLNYGANMCYATQGEGYLNWRGADFQCDQAD